MQAFLAVASLLLAVVVAVLAYLVGRLQAQQASLHRELAEARTSHSMSPPLPARGRSTATDPEHPARTPAPTPAADPEPVAVITHLTDVVDTPDPTAFRVASVTLAGPLIKVAAFSTGVRRALDEEHRFRIAYTFRRELRRQQKLRSKKVRQRQRDERAESGGWRA